MSRALKESTAQTITGLMVIIAIVGLVGGIAKQESNPGHVQTAINSQQQVTELSYHGQNGVNALTLLKKYAQITTKHYSFGDFVVSIDGTVGNGPKYWTLYVNNKQSDVGASDYITKNDDTITWKLQ